MESIEPRLLKRFFAAVAAAALLVPVFILAAQAAGGEKTADVFRDPNGRLMSVARMGDWRNYPENSAAGIRSCIAMGVDIIEVDVRKAADGTMMLFKDDDLSRTCVGPDGKPAEREGLPKNGFRVKRAESAARPGRPKYARHAL